MREAESRESERGSRPGVGASSLLPCLSLGENRLNSGDWRLERGGEQRLERKVKFLGF